MATYIVSTINKKSTIENEYWAHKKDPNKSFRKEIGWRWGNFQLSLTKPEYEEINKDDENGEFYPYSYENSELIDCTDGCWEDFDFSEGTITEAEQEEIQAAWEENSYEGLEELGYQQIDGEVVLLGPLKFEREDGCDEDEEEHNLEEEDIKPFTTLAQTLKDLNDK